MTSNNSAENDSAKDKIMEDKALNSSVSSMNSVKDKVVEFTVEQVMAEGMREPLNLVLNSGDICMLFGVSGVGKSQFLKSLADLIEHQGKVKLNQQNQQSTEPCQWRAKVMYFAAETAWWEDSIAAHFESKLSTSECEQLGLDEVMLQKSPDNLSSGEKQRFALLRGLQYSPQVLLLDEITANLDHASKLKVEAFLKNYQANNQSIIIWISHDSEQIQRLATHSIEFTKGEEA